MAQFWIDEDTPDEVRAMELESWVDVLGDATPDELRQAWAEYQRSGPRSEAGRLARPDAGALYRTINKARATAALTRPAPRDRQLAAPPRVTPEKAAEIMAQVGFRPKAFPGVGEGRDD